MEKVSIRAIRRRAEVLARQLRQDPGEIQRQLIKAHEQNGIEVDYEPRFEERADLNFTEPTLRA